ncbi:MAG: hypothetical protein K0Q95_1013 [Bacteroidota bacterium]|jgi:hypothetical protein|nr:hypothetical protein [Bacteroidota bacterium]
MKRSLIIFLFAFCSLIGHAQEAWVFQPDYYPFDTRYNDTLKDILKLKPKIDSIIKGSKDLNTLKPFNLNQIAAYIEHNNYDSVICKKLKIVLKDKNSYSRVFDLVLENSIQVPYNMLKFWLPEHTQLHKYNSTDSDVIYSREEMDVVSNIKVQSRFTDKSKNRWLNILLHSVVYSSGPYGDKYEDRDFSGWIKEEELEIRPFNW